MSLLLCRQEAVKRPYYVEALDVHLYSSQELCYVIYHHPLLVMEDFVDESLTGFIRDELNMEFLAEKLEKWAASGENPDEMLFAILSECAYYRPGEISQYRQQVATLRKKPAAEFQKERADYLFGIGQYGRAAQLYRSLLENPEYQGQGDAFTGAVWNNLGAAYSRLFQTAKAYDAFEKAYGCRKDGGLVKKMYMLSKLNPRLEDRLPALDEEKKRAWSKEFEKAEAEAAQSRAVLKLEQMFGRGETGRNEEAARLVKKWKKEYRSMV